MDRQTCLVVSCLVAGLFFGSNPSIALAKPAATPRVFLMNAAKLEQVKKGIRSNDKQYQVALASIENAAKKALAGATYSVTSKTVTPPSGDKHDYMSQAPYFWPDPTKKDGLPYIRKDGERNPEINKITDHSNMDKMVGAVGSLSLAYYFKGDEAYAAMRAVNPVVIPRNHRVEEALSAAEDRDDLSVLHQLLEVLASPYAAGADLARYQDPPPDDCGYQTFCGT